MIPLQNLLYFFFLLGWNNDFLSSVVYSVCTWCIVDRKIGRLKEPRAQSWECHSSNRLHLSLKRPLISSWLMTHRAIMVLRALHIHSLSSSSSAPGEKPQQCEVSRHTKQRSRRTRIQMLIKKDVSPLCHSVMHCHWEPVDTETIEHRRDGRWRRKHSQFNLAIKNGFISV